MKQMTNEYAKEVIQRYYMLFNEEYKKALDVAMDVMDKQVPRKLTEDGKCPCCGNFNIIGHYCPRCGQAIDWDESR